MSRPPKEAWSKAAEACRSLLACVEQLTANRAPPVAEMLDAQRKVLDFCEHVETSEECEMD